MYLLFIYPFLLFQILNSHKNYRNYNHEDEICLAYEVFRNTNLICDDTNDRLYCVELQANDKFDAEGNSISHLWLLGDGSMKPGYKIEHCYNVYGEYEIKLSSTKDIQGLDLKDTTIYTLDVGEIALIQDIKEDRFVYFFDGSSSFIGDEYEVINYYWSFGDGNYACDMLVTNRYSKPGDYEVKLIVEAVSNSGEIKQICGIKEIAIR